MIANGKQVYNLAINKRTAKGIVWSNSELDSALQNEVNDLLIDKKGQDDVNAKLAVISRDLGLNSESIKLKLRNSLNLQNLNYWMIGEAIAISYLEKIENCLFPWPSERDKRTPKASLPGADLLGFLSDKFGHCFLFGEIKTSNEIYSPPKVMRGKKGMTQQLLRLNDAIEIREQCIKYLSRRIGTGNWDGIFYTAYLRYQKDDSDFKLYGVLIRDTEPNSKDLKSCLKNLDSKCSPKTQVELLGLYLPKSSLHNLGTYFNCSN